MSKLTAKNDHTMRFLEGMLEDNLSMIRNLTETISLCIRYREKTSNENLSCELNLFVIECRKYIESLYNSIKFNRRMICERREELREAGRRNSEQLRIANGT